MRDALTLLAPLSGVVVPLGEVPDPAFAERLAGDGAGVEPLGDRVLAPCDARVGQVHGAHHALTLECNGLEIIIHVGIDTILLQGEGFTPLVKAGDEVRAGDPLLAFDADFVARRARSLISVMLVANTERVASVDPAPAGERVRAGRDPLLRVTLRAPEESGADTSHSVTVTSEPIVVGTPTGLHARPAAVLAAAARRFTSDLRLVKGGREANVRSVVSIMALEVGGGDTVTLVGHGEDADEAVAELTRTLRSGLGDAHAPAAAEREKGEAPPPFRAPSVDGVLHGAPASPGVAIGRVFQLRHDDIVPEERAADANQERRALDAAIAAAHLQLEALRARLTADADEEKAAIFGAHQELLEDPEVLDRAAAEIRSGASAAHAWRQSYMTQAERLLTLRNPVFAGRAADLRDVGRRVLHLLAGHEGAPHDLPEDAIIVAEELAPSDVATLDRHRVRGLATTMGSATSHAAILARGLGIPAVTGLDPRVLDLSSGTRVVLDGSAGTLHASPSTAEAAAATRRRHADERRRAAELAVAAEPAITRDGHRVEVVANLGDVSEAARVVEVGGEGVGLLRTEFMFMDRRAAPDEEEQTRSYESVARALGPERILVIRTLDVGGDKPLSYLPVGVEANPFLGERGIRLSLAHPELFRAQIRAILRAGRVGRVAMMFPMVATMGEWRVARRMVEEERASSGAPALPVGIMVETAAAALLADHFAREADFFSIGTNDLTQYTLAMDRGNPRLADQVDALDPAVLRLIERTVAGARAHGRWVGICGALAGDPVAVPVLIGLGVSELSADIPLVPSVKARVRSLHLEECRTTARRALDAPDAATVRELVSERHG